MLDYILSAPGRSPLRLRLCDDETIEPQQGFYAVAADIDATGRTHITAAAQASGGVFHSAEGGETKTFHRIGLENTNIQHLSMHESGNQLYVWAGSAAIGPTRGAGPQRFTLTNAAAGWQNFDRGWLGGSCTGIVVHGEYIFATSHHAGVLQLDPRSDDATWRSSAIGCGLAIREDIDQLAPLRAIAVRTTDTDSAPNNGSRPLELLVGGPDGIYRNRDECEKLRFERAASRVVDDRITIPPDWLFTSLPHEIEVIPAHDA